MPSYLGKEFNEQQIAEINRGLQSGVDVLIYAKPNLSPVDMYQIRVALEEGLNIKEYVGSGFDSNQLAVIIKGLRQGINVKIFANPEISAENMKQMLLNEINKRYKPKETYSNRYKYKGKIYTRKQMILIKKGLNENLDVSLYADDKFSCDQMLVILRGLREGLDVSVYASPSYTPAHMNLLRKGLKEGLNVSKYANPELKEAQYVNIYMKLSRYKRDSIVTMQSSRTPKSGIRKMSLF